ncbi:MAG: LysE family transporter [Cyanobacteria bacterium J06621_11]
MWIVLIKGILMGLAIAVPVGPIGLLCIRRTLAQGRWIGLASGCGAATADASYCIIAAFGLTALSDLLVANTTYLQWFGGLFLCYLGLKTFFSSSSSEASPSEVSYSESSQSEVSPSRTSLAESSRAEISANSQRVSLLPAYSSTLILTLTNPATILSFIAIFAGLGITQADYLQSVTLVFGVFSGSLLWWLVLVSGVAYLRGRLTPQRLTRFNAFSSKVFGLMIFAFGIAAFSVSL